MRDEAQRPRNEGRGAQAHAPPPLQGRGEGDDADADPAETSRTERRRKKYVREAVTERDKKRRGRAGSLSSKRDDDGAPRRARHGLISFRSNSGEFGPNGRSLRGRNPFTACIPCIQAHSSGESAMPHSSLPPLQTISTGPFEVVYTLPSGECQSRCGGLLLFCDHVTP